jgi:GT2 family glycosyltransferase
VNVRVSAVVLTYNAPIALEQCLSAIARQTRPVDAVIIVDNASSEPVDDLAHHLPQARVLRLAENLGPAGGYAHGLEAFLEDGDDFAWIMDDDCVPAADALAWQLTNASRSRVVMATMLDPVSGDVTNTQGWCAVLVPQAVIVAVGLPDSSLFWWTEDTEYLQWRIPRAGFDVDRCDRAYVQVSRMRSGHGKPPWKYYYEARNQVHYRLHTQRPTPGEAVPRYLKFRVRAWRAARSAGQLGILAVFREPAGRARKLAMVGRGIVDGVRGRLGRLVATDDPHRPTPATNMER